MTTFVVAALEAGERDLGEEATHHATVKRLAVGDAVDLTDGRGRRGAAVIASMSRKLVRVTVAEVRAVARPSEIHLFVPVADKDRMLWIAEKATELQVASWNPVMYERSRSVTPRGEGEAFDRKVAARMSAALEQSGGAWLPEIRPIRTVQEIAGEPGFFLERGGNALAKTTLAAPVRLAIGPEGGFASDEITTLRSGGWTSVALGSVTLRFETAAIGAVSIARALLP